MSQLEFLDTPGSQPRYQELSGGWNARNAAPWAPACPRPAPPRPQVGKVNDTVFVKGLGQQVHANRRTKTDSVPRGCNHSFTSLPRTSAFQARMLRAPGSGEGQEATD